MATAGLTLLFLLAGMALMVVGGAITLASVRSGKYLSTHGIGIMPDNPVAVCRVIDTLPRRDQLQVTLAGVITMSDAEIDAMARTIEERHSAQLAAQSVPVRQPEPVVNPLRRMIFGRTRNLDLG